MTNFDEKKSLVDVTLSNGLIDIRFAPFPSTACLQRKMPSSPAMGYDHKIKY